MLSVCVLFAQNSALDEPNPETVGNDSAMASLREVSVDKFEREGSWNVRISSDDGCITARLFEGAPAMKEPLEEDKGKENEDTQVFGIKTEFFRRGVNSFYITSGRPLAIEGTVKTISLWVCGRNQSHDMYVLVQDYFGSNFELYLGNLDAKRDWGYAKDYVECMWLMLQQDKPDDFVVATGEQHSVREFCELAFRAAGIELEFKGSGVEEKANNKATGEILIEVDPIYFRPAEVETLLGDPTKAKTILGWNPTKTSFNELVSLMMKHDMEFVEKEHITKM